MKNTKYPINHQPQSVTESVGEDGDGVTVTQMIFL